MTGRPRPRVVWVSPELPDRFGGGGNQRQAELLVRAARDVDIDLVVPAPPQDPLVLERARSIEATGVPEASLPAGLRGRAVAAWLAFGRRTPLEVATARATRTAAGGVIDRLAPGADAVIVHHQAFAPLLRAPRPGDTGRWALSLFHATGDRNDQAAAVATTRTRRLLLRAEAANGRRIERRAITAADVLVVTTEEDGRRLGQPSTPTRVVAQGVDLERFRPAPLPAEPVVLYSGSLDYQPNVDGVCWFARAVWPLVRTEVPGARLLVVGRSPHPDVAALASGPGVEVHADVPDMRPWMEQARVSLATLRVGTGVRVKVLEALAAGLPVVATTVGMEGIRAPGEAADVADTPAALAAAVVALLSSDRLAEERRRAGRAFVERHHTWDGAAATLVDALVG